jgi:NAD(P)H-nitrite reductase large subunit
MSSRAASATHNSRSADGADIVIVGNGIAGLTTAVEARRLSPDASIVIITDQSHPTINTPALKQFAVGKLTQEQLLAYPPGMEKSQRIHVICARVEEINAQGKFVGLRGGIGFGYGSLVIASGSSPTALPAHIAGRDFDGVLTLHCLQDYMNLRRRIAEVEEAVVIGGGAHATETVMGLLHLGIQVHWLIRGKTLLGKTLDEYASEMILEHFRHAGARIYLQTQVKGIVGRVGSVVGVITNHNQMLPCELVLACTGTTPITTLAEHCSMPMLHKNGIMVDDHLRTSVRDIYAAGDVAAIRQPQTGVHETRPLWNAAVLQGRAVAAMVTGHHELAAQPFGVPWHATQLGELRMLSVGTLHARDRSVTTLTGGNRRSYYRLSVADDRLVGYLSLGPNQPDSLAIKRIIDEGLSIRDVRKALLNGSFDARRYFSRQQSYVARDLVTSGKIPAVTWMQTPAPAARPRHTGGLASTSAASHAPFGSHARETGGALPFNDSLLTPPHLPALPLPPQEEEEIGSFTGNLPGVADSAWAAAAARTSSARSVEPMLVPLPSRPSTRSLWSYTGNLPAVEAMHPSSRK